MWKQHCILLFTSCKSLSWTIYFRFHKYWKGLQSWPRVSTDDVTNLLLLHSFALIKPPLSSVSLLPLETFTDFTFVLICEMWTFIFLCKVKCCSSEHLMFVKELLPNLLSSVLRLFSSPPKPLSTLPLIVPLHNIGMAASFLCVKHSLTLNSLFSLHFLFLTVLDLHCLCLTQLIPPYSLGNCLRSQVF